MLLQSNLATPEADQSWKTAKILQPQETYTVEYTQAVDFTDQQMAIYWLPDEIKVEKDIQDIKVNMSDAESHGVITVLKLFLQYELMVGNEHWGNVINKTFRRPEIEAMSSLFSTVELAIHARFYNKINELLGLNTEEFFLAYKTDPTLTARMDFIEDHLDPEDLPLSLAAFTLIEGAVLYASMAYLKHFQSNADNRLVNISRGIGFSAKDEHLHSVAGAWLFSTILQESDTPVEIYEAKVKMLAEQVFEHEAIIIDQIFEKGEMPGIDAHNLKQFVKHRINVCCQNLGMSPLYEDEENNIGEWFYDGLNAVLFHDFFTGIGNSYERTYAETSFAW